MSAVKELLSRVQELDETGMRVNVKLGEGVLCREEGVYIFYQDPSEDNPHGDIRTVGFCPVEATSFIMEG